MPALRGFVAACTECPLRLSPGVLVPSRDDSRVVVEARTTRLVVGDSYATLLHGGPSVLRPGQVLFHDAAADRPIALFRDFEIDDHGLVAGNVLVRLDPRPGGIWLLSVR